MRRLLKAILPSGLYEKLSEKFKEAKDYFAFENIKKRYDRFKTLAVRYPNIYKRNSKNPIDENKILFIDLSDKLKNDFQCLYRILSEEYNFNIHIHLMKRFLVSDQEYDENCKALIEDIATAKYVFVDEGYNVLGRIHFRKETLIVSTWHACGAFKKFGFSTADLKFGATRKDMEKYPYYNYYTFVTVSSPDIVSNYAEAMGLPEDKILPIGVSRTDVFYDEDFVAAARKKLDLFMPSSVGKKVILFAPTFRGRIAKATTATAFSVERFFNELSDDYVLILKHHPHVKKPPVIPEKYREFAVDFTNVMSIEELLCVADICISDYSSLVFEYSLFERPMIFFDYDIDEYFDWRGFYYNYDELTPGPAFKTNREMIDYIKHVDERFDKQQVIDFKNKFMSACDGHSTERILAKTFGEELEKHRKETPDIEVQPEEATVSAVAMSQTAIEKLKEKLYEKYPVIEGKTIIADFVTNREDVGYPHASPFLSWKTLWEDLDEQYIIIYDGDMPNRYAPKKFQGTRFIKNEDLMSPEELGNIADIVVTDFRYDIGIQWLEKKKTFIYLPDYKWYCNSVEDFEQSTEELRESGLFYDDMDELIEAIGNVNLKAQTDSLSGDYYRKICDHYND